MKIFIQRFLLGAAIGVTLGVVAELIFSFISGVGYTPGVPSFLVQFENENFAVLVERGVYAGMGVVQYFAAFIFDVERLSLATATALHCLIVLATVISSGFYLHWMAAPSLLPFVLFALAAYLLIWLGFYIYWRAEVKRANATLAG